MLVNTLFSFVQHNSGTLLCMRSHTLPLTDLFFLRKPFLISAPYFFVHIAHNVLFYFNCKLDLLILTSFAFIEKCINRSKSTLVNTLFSFFKQSVGTFVHMRSHSLFPTDMYFPRKPYVASTLNLLYHIIIVIVFFLENLTYLLSHTIIYI